jgi:hypothetical protein
VEDLLVLGGHDKGGVRVFQGGCGHAGVDDVSAAQPRQLHGVGDHDGVGARVQRALGGYRSGGDEYKKGASKYRKDRQALTAICSVMPMDVMQHMISKTSAKEVWDMLKILNLGHAGVREATLQTLKKYEKLEMKEEETLDAFSSRVATIVNGIHRLDKKP